MAKQSVAIQKALKDNNLTSKEIAPLLNISSRSVEVKRYRLRKKMDLPHESSLTDYILEI